MSITKRVEELITPLIEENNFELVDVQFVTECGKKVLRVFLDKEGGIQLKDCEEMSSKIGEILDTSEILNYSYVLEVSSPGIERVLKKEKDFLKFLGQKARITVFEPIEGQRHFQGEILGCGDCKVEIKDVSGKTFTIEIDKIARANLCPDI